MPMDNRYKITFAKLMGESLLDPVEVKATGVELENGFFTFTGFSGGREEIVKSVSASIVQEVALIEVGA